MVFKTVDLCAGIGGMRRGFEMTGFFKNVMASEIDPYACKTYEHLYHQDAFHDLKSESFRKNLEDIPFDVLLAGFPCQTFSRAGKEEGFLNNLKEQYFGILPILLAEIGLELFFWKMWIILFDIIKGKLSKKLLKLWKSIWTIKLLGYPAIL